jgi:hypothetical protein
MSLRDHGDEFGVISRSWWNPAGPSRVNVYLFIHWDEFAISEMYSAGMLDEEGRPFLGRARMTEDQASRLRNRGSPGGLVTVSAAGRQEV